MTGAGPKLGRGEVDCVQQRLRSASAPPAEHALGEDGSHVSLCAFECPEEVNEQTSAERARDEQRAGGLCRAKMGGISGEFAEPTEQSSLASVTRQT